MKLHILPGDSLAEPFKKTNMDGEFAVCRECLVDGDLSAGNLDEFWRVRENYLSAAYPDSAGSYRQRVRGEFERLLELPAGCEVFLWFEYELFCQVNMWFCLYLLKDTKAAIYRVAPHFNQGEDIWSGFGHLSPEGLEKSFAGRQQFGRDEIRLGVGLWTAFRDNEFERLKELSTEESKCYPFLGVVCDAAIKRETRPRATLKKIIDRGETEFDGVFRAFNRLEGVYGFGDAQVRRMYDELV